MLVESTVVESKEGIEDRKEANLRWIIYLTIMNALNYEEAVHKLLKVELQEVKKSVIFLVFLFCFVDQKTNRPI